MTIKVRMPAPPESRFAADAFEGQIGAIVQVTIPGRLSETHHRTLLSATVAIGGAFADLEFDDDVEWVSAGPFSLAPQQHRDQAV